MSKGTLITLGIVLALIGGVYWLLGSISFRRPISHVVQIETAGGPVPLYIIVLPGGGTVIHVGHDIRSRPATFLQSYEGQVEVLDLDFDSRSYRLGFPGTDATLQLERIEGDPRAVEGTWSATNAYQTIIRLPARSVKTANANWFMEPTPKEIADAKTFDFTGRWDISFAEGVHTAQFEVVNQWMKQTGTEGGWIDADLATLDVPNRYFAGRAEGNRIMVASFDGGMPCLVTAVLQPDGTLAGELCFADQPVRAFTATPPSP